MVPSAPLLNRNDAAPAYWFLDILWIVLAAGRDTDGRLTIMEQLMPQGAGPGRHVHPAHDEWFYVMDGALDMILAGASVHAAQGQSVFIPRGTAHAFKVVSQTCRVLNGFTPAGMDDVVARLARPADRRTLPPAGLPVSDENLRAFADNAMGHPV